MSELCHIPSETPGKHRGLRGHSDAHRCCGKSLIGSALVRFSVRQHARAESISKRASSNVLRSLTVVSSIDAAGATADHRRSRGANSRYRRGVDLGIRFDAAMYNQAAGKRRRVHVEARGRSGAQRPGPRPLVREPAPQVRPDEAVAQMGRCLAFVAEGSRPTCIPFHVRLLWWMRHLHPSLATPLVRKMVASSACCRR